LYQDYIDSVQKKIRDLVKVNEMYNLTDLEFKLETDLSKMRSKIVENWKNNKLKQPDLLISNLYSVNDIISCTFVSNSVNQTKYIFDSLVSPNDDFRMYDLQNDFANLELGPTEYRYIKLILATKFTPYTELIQVNIYQKRDMHFYKIWEKFSSIIDKKDY